MFPAGGRRRPPLRRAQLGVRQHRGLLQVRTPQAFGLTNIFFITGLPIQNRCDCEEGYRDLNAGRRGDRGHVPDCAPVDPCAEEDPADPLCPGEHSGCAAAGPGRHECRCRPGYAPDATGACRREKPKKKRNPRRVWEIDVGADLQRPAPAVAPTAGSAPRPGGAPARPGSPAPGAPTTSTSAPAAWRSTGAAAAPSASTRSDGGRIFIFSS